MNLVESAPFNIGNNKLYEGVAGNLVAYACKVRFKKALKDLLPLMQRQNLFITTKGH